MIPDCIHFNAKNCTSCQLLVQPYFQQCIDKQLLCEEALSCFSTIAWLPLVESKQVGFRNKAKMVVSGHWQNPILGLFNQSGVAVDLTDCLLYPTALQASFSPIRQWISDIQLMPYDILQRTGELKFVLVTLSEQTNTIMIRFVLRSKKMLAVMREALPLLQNSLTTLAVVSVNIQPIAMAIVEGKEEIILTSQTRLMMLINELSLFIQPQSFFQTNDAVAAALYRQAQDWICEIQPNALWDLFCGVGGFALHAAQVMRGAVTGIELSEQAIASAQASAQLLIKTNNIEFRAVSSDDFAFVQTDVPECVIVNPPRRGIGAALCAFLNDANDIQWIIYSSCNPKSLTQDLSRLTLFTPIKARVFDMFPHTHHAEVLVLLKRVQG